MEAHYPVETGRTGALRVPQAHSTREVCHSFSDIGHNPGTVDEKVVFGGCLWGTIRLGRSAPRRNSCPGQTFAVRHGAMSSLGELGEGRA